LNTFHVRIDKRYRSFGVHLANMGMAGKWREFYLIGDFAFFDAHSVMDD
jgi:hypothetical protein